MCAMSSTALAKTGAFALLGRAVDGGYNHTTGTILGGVVGALLGKSVAQKTTCR